MTDVSTASRSTSAGSHDVQLKAIVPVTSSAVDGDVRLRVPLPAPRRRSDAGLNGFPPGGMPSLVAVEDRGAANKLNE